MSRSVGEKKHGGNETNALMVMNPRDKVIGDRSDQVMRVAEGYSGEVYRLDNIERLEDPAEFYEKKEHLMDTIDEVADEGEHLDPFWYDRAYLFDSGGLDSADQRGVTRESSTLEFIGGPLEDIATVVASLEAGGNDASYVLNRQLAFDYAGWNQEQGYVEEELRSLGDLLEVDEPSMRERLEHHRLDRENVNF